LQYGQRLSSFAAHQSDEIVLLTTFGTVLLVAGVAQYLSIGKTKICFQKVAPLE
jgi:monovalent cation:H+ antiporter-2, CPA2 family